MGEYDTHGQQSARGIQHGLRSLTLEFHRPNKLCVLLA